MKSESEPETCEPRADAEPWDMPLYATHPDLGKYVLGLDALSGFGELALMFFYLLRGVFFFFSSDREGSHGRLSGTTRRARRRSSRAGRAGSGP